MIQITCPGCNSRLSAKDGLLGEKRKCPKCGTEVLISVVQSAKVPAGTEERSAAPEPAGGDSRIHRTPEATFKQAELLERLDRQNHYLICDKAKLVATWQSDGKGWMLKTNFGLVSALRNGDKLPAQGDFKLVELRLDMTGDGLRLDGIRSYQLAQRWALTSLDKGDDQIAAKITALGFLNREQKNAVRNAIKDQFMRGVWEGADNVLAYLGNIDYHSPGTE